MEFMILAAVVIFCVLGIVYFKRKKSKAPEEGEEKEDIDVEELRRLARERSSTRSTAVARSKVLDKKQESLGNAVIDAPTLVRSINAAVIDPAEASYTETIIEAGIAREEAIAIAKDYYTKSVVKAKLELDGAIADANSAYEGIEEEAWKTYGTIMEKSWESRKRRIRLIADNSEKQ